ncbi:MAG: DMT family transporter [Actinomycetota bacterium]|nr:DMT family transporter [Actinomycetota bacterium]
MSRRSSSYTWIPWTVLAVGVVAASVSAILIRYADGAHGIAVAFWRCAAGAAVLAPFAAPGLRRMTRRQFVIPALAGVSLAAHFATWIPSVNLTSIASSVLLVSTTPIFVAIVARFAFNDRLGARGWFGIWLALAGVVLIAGLDFEGSTFVGNILALLGGITVAGYAIAGQRARQFLGILEYAAATYFFAAVVLLPVCLIGGYELGGYDNQTWWAIVGLIAGPQLLGHTLINFSLRAIDATTVSVTVMGEPVIAIALAFVFFHEVPSVLAYPGGVAILIGIYLVSVVRRAPAMIVE